jgi:hypothetical protein
MSGAPPKLAAGFAASAPDMGPRRRKIVQLPVCARTSPPWRRAVRSQKGSAHEVVDPGATTREGTIRVDKRRVDQLALNRR